MGNPDDNSVADLLRQAREGDQTAREALFSKCRAFVGIAARTQVESWLRAKVDASDLVQQTMLDAHRGFAEFRGVSEAEWLAWLKQILSHNATDYVRRFKGEKRRANREVPIDRRTAGNSGNGELQLRGADESPSQLAMKVERELRVADAIAELPADYQDVIVLRNLQQLPFAEVAERMGRSGPATQMLWLRALRKLQELLERHDDFKRG